jgi:hypothetical protein
VRTVQEVSNLINCLTNNEDLRQDLWVLYLSGKPLESLPDHLEQLNAEYTEDQKVKDAMWQLIKNPPSESLYEILEEFTDFERSIMCLLALGLSIDKIALFKGINQVRIRQAISSIRYNSSWDKYYGIKEKLNR